MRPPSPSPWTAAALPTLTGTTSSTEATFPNGAGLVPLGVPGFDQSYNGGPFDAFVAKLAPTGQSLAYLTYLGGSDEDQGADIAWTVAEPPTSPAGQARPTPRSRTAAGSMRWACPVSTRLTTGAMTRS